MIALVPALALLARCGNARTPPPNLTTPVVPHHARTVTVPLAGIRLRVSGNWTLALGQSPLVMTLSSDQALVAVWHYPRAETLPTTMAALEQARLALLGAARERYGRLRVIRSAVELLHGRHALELSAAERIAGQARCVRSVHVFFGGVEYVIDEYAPLRYFHAVDHSVFSAIKRSLRLSPVARA